MDYFFHADTTKYRRRLRGTAIIVLVPLFGVCVFCAVNILLNLGAGNSSGILKLMALVIVICVLAGMTTMFAAALLAKKYTARHSRFTYLDILPDGFVFSLYAGEFRNWDDQVILRRLYFVPFSGIEEISRDQKASPCSLTVKGKVRCYFEESSRLGYHVGEDGHTQFDSPELNERGFETADKLEINGSVPRRKYRPRLSIISRNSAQYQRKSRSTSQNTSRAGRKNARQLPTRFWRLRATTETGNEKTGKIMPQNGYFSRNTT